MEVKTKPASHIYCKGGIIEIMKDDFDLVVRLMRGEDELNTFGGRGE